MAELTGQTAFVTGASSGLGRRFALILARAGAKVAVAARRRPLLDTLVEEIRAEGGTAEAVVLDVADAAAIPPAIDTAEAALGPVSILVNNAGIGMSLPSIDQDVAEIDALLAINVRAPFLLAREVARRLIAAGRPGRIVNLSSVAAFSCTPATPPATMYAASKAAVRWMTDRLAMEWARHRINVNGIAPGYFKTEMFEGLGEEQIQALAASTARGRLGVPEQLDSTLLYLVSPASEFVTGVTILVDDAQSTR